MCSSLFLARRHDIYSTPFLLFCCFAIRCNNELLRLIAPCQKETATHAKHHSTEDFRVNGFVLAFSVDGRLISLNIFQRFLKIDFSAANTMGLKFGWFK